MLSRLCALAAVAGAVPIRKFNGQRYATPPVGDKRFAPAEVAPFNESTFLEPGDGRFGPRCMQTGSPRPPTCTRENSTTAEKCINEDCLFLNVATPNASLPAAAGGEGSAPPVPILVWIHGGGWTAGAGSDYDGGALAASQNIMVVTINYRLGVLGWYASDELAAEPGSENATGGMNGVRDQIAALRWIAANAARFGGDSARVTIAGESAGAESVCTLLVAPPAAGLFSRAVVESGPCSGGRAGWGAHPRGESLRASAKATQNRSLAELRAVEDGYELLQGASRDAAGVGSDDNYDKVQDAADGFVLPGEMAGPADASPAAALLVGGALNAEAVLIGGNSFDGLLSYSLPYEAPLGMLSREAYATKMADAWDADAAAVMALYDVDARFGGNTNAAYVRPDADAGVLCPSLAIAGALAARGVAAYAYLFDYGPVCDDVGRLFATPGAWASHAAEIAWVFGARASCYRDESELALTAAMQDLWGSFARGGGDPASGALTWDPYTRDGGALMVLDLAPRVERGVKAADCAALLAINASLWPAMVA